jgi:hypothetical protein
MDITAAFAPSSAARGAPRQRPSPIEQLAPGRTVALRLAPGTALCVDAGRLWITEPGDPDDHFVGAGGCHVVRRAGVVVLECDSAEPARWWKL